MLELLFCSLITILPDYLFRRYHQGKRIGHEITLFTVWYELRWGITACLILTVAFITVIFYYHPSTHTVSALYRTVTILPESGGRVTEVYAGLDDEVAAGDPIFMLDSAAQEAALAVARSRVAETDAALAVAKTELAAADGLIQQAEGAYKQALDELATKSELMERNSSTVTEREIERLQTAADGRKGAVTAALANKETLQEKINSLLPAQKASAEAAVSQAQIELDKRTVRAGVAGKVQQFVLRPGDIVTMFRPAGILLPDAAGRRGLVAGFDQISAGVMKVGMIGEVTCAARPFVVIPVIVTGVQDVIAAGQVRGSDQLFDVQQVAPGGTITVFMDALYPGQLEGIPPGSSCIANAYTSNEERLATEELGFTTRIFLHVVDTVGVVHAAILRIQALLLPVTTLVLSGH